MQTLCKLFKVPGVHFDQIRLPESLREVDFYLIDKKSKYHRCEVKLMGKGNPESAEQSSLVIPTYSLQINFQTQTRNNLDSLKIQWVELRSKKGYKKFEKVLKALSIPYTPFRGDLDEALDAVVSETPDEEVQAMAEEGEML